MKPILYEKNETNFEHLGIGVLSEAISAIVTEERNSIFEALIKYPLDGALFNQLDYDSIIKIKPNDSSECQLFRVYKVSKPINGIVTYNLEHISYQLNKNPVAFIAGTGTAQSALDSLMNGAATSHIFTAESDVEKTAQYEISFESIRSGIKKIRDYFGGELEWDNFSIKLHSARGTDTGIIISYGKNLTDLKEDINVSSVYTAIMPYAEKENDNGDKIRYTIPEKYIACNNSASFSYLRILPVDFSSDFSDDETINAAGLRAKANAYIAANNVNELSRNIKVSFVHLWQTKEYENIAALERVSLCDIVTVRDLRLNINVKAKVIKTVYNALTEKYDNIELGTAKNDLSNSFTDVVKQVKKANKRIDKANTKISKTNTQLQNLDNSINDKVSEYIQSEAGTQKLENVLTGHFTVYDDLTGLTRVTDVKNVISQQINENGGSIKLYVEGKNYITRGDAEGEFVAQQDLYAGIGTYIDTQQGTAKIVSSVSSTYQTKGAMSDYYTKSETSASITQAVSKESASIKLEVNGKFQKYSTTTEMNSAITLALNGITLSTSESTSQGQTTSTITMKKGNTTISSTSVTGVNKTQAATIAADAVNGITLSASNGTTKSTLSIKSGSTTISSAEIEITGMVKFSDLSEKKSTTVINGGNITTGKISADYIDTDKIALNGVYNGAGSVLSSSRKCVIDCSDTYKIYIGGASNSTSVNEVIIRANQKIQFGKWGGSGDMVIDLSSKTFYSDSACIASLGTSSKPWGDVYISELHLYGASTQYVTGVISGNTYQFRPYSSDDCTLGSSSYPWRTAYLRNIEITNGNIELGNSSAKLGFFGTTPVSRKSLSSSASLSDLITALKGYGLFS